MSRKPKPDNRLNWRDKNMPVIRFARKANEPNSPMVLQEVEPKLVQDYHKWAVQQPNVNPHWSDDPSYWWSRKK